MILMEGRRMKGIDYRYLWENVFETRPRQGVRKMLKYPHVGHKCRPTLTI
jgi:hypothetical protein